jgi:hypothetical protein
MSKTKEYMKQWRLKNKEHIKEYDKEYYQKNIEYKKEYRLKNKERKKETDRKWQIKNQEYRREYKKKYYLNNIESFKKRSLNNKENRNKRKKNRRLTDPIYRLKLNMVSAMSDALAGRSKSAPTMKIIGCTVEELFEHLELCSTWEPWMTRENYGKNGWDVDHIIPISQWDDKCPLQFTLCWDRSNLQPMEHIANIKKGAKIISGDITSPKM